MNIPKAIFFDVDGTLISRGEMPKSTREALFYAKDKGVMLVVATGRHKMEVHEVPDIKKIPFDGFVTLNGGYCYVGDTVVYKNPLSKETIEAVVGNLLKAPAPCMFCEAEKIYINMVNDHVREINGNLGLAIPPVQDYPVVNSPDIYQMVAYEDLSEPGFFHDLAGCKATSSAYGTMDIISATTNKWVGITHIMKFFGLQATDIAAIGDAPNDIEMLKGVGYPVVMGNASDEVKKHAKYVTAHVDNDGLFQAIKHLCSYSG